MYCLYFLESTLSVYVLYAFSRKYSISLCMHFLESTAYDENTLQKWS